MTNAELPARELPQLPQPPEYYMRQLITGAAPYHFAAAPNPTVGAMLVSPSQGILATGYHEQFGGPHAEVNCLKNIDGIPSDAVFFVTLEPCDHRGKTPPCTDLLLQKNVRHVVIGCRDSNPSVNGKGIRKLVEHGINVQVGVLEDEARYPNRIFFKNIRENQPYVAVKFAVTFDGKTAMSDGSSKWITGAAARAKGHYYRSFYQSVAVGKGTFLTDKPALDNRSYPDLPAPNALIFCGSRLPPVHPEFARANLGQRFFIVDSEGTDIPEKSTQDGRIIHYHDRQRSIKPVLNQLFDCGIRSIMIEGGSTLATSFFREGLVDAVHVFTAPDIIAKPTAPGMTGDIAGVSLAHPIRFEFRQPERIDRDIELIAEKSVNQEE